MLQCWRWFGDKDPVSLGDARQAGAQGIVTALHDLYDGRSWSADDISAHTRKLAAAGFDWSVCESIPMHTSIKLRTGAWRKYLDSWKDSLASLGRAGVPIVCYNFMPVVDWTRTNLRYPMPSGGLALRFDMTDFVAYDVFVLKRPGADRDYDPDLMKVAETRLSAMSEDDIFLLENNIICGLPGGEDSHTRQSILAKIAEFDGVSDDDMRANLFAFLEEVVPVAAEVGVRLAVHPDDPPFSLFGLPRVVSTPDDIRGILGCVDHEANGLTLCVGSLSSRPDNDATAIAAEFARRIHFAHLRNVTCEPDGSFVEADHLGGRADMVQIVSLLLAEERRRREAGHPDPAIAMRPDHGHLLLDDIGRQTNPGYSCIGRLKGLAELRGVMAAVGSLQGLNMPHATGRVSA